MSQELYPPAVTAAAVSTADLDTGAGTDTRSVVGALYAASGGAVLVSAANPLPVTGGGVAQGSTTSGQVGLLIQGAVTATVPSYTTAQTSPLSLDTSGNLRTSVNNNVSVITRVETVRSATPPSFGATVLGVYNLTQPTLTDGTVDFLQLSPRGAVRVVPGTETFATSATQSGTWTVQQGGSPWSVLAAQSGSWGVDTELPSAVALADGASNPTTPLVGSCDLAWNGTAWDRRGGVLATTGLVSAARTASASFTITNTGGWRNLFVFLNVTAASGTGGLTVQINTGDPVSGNLAQLNANPTAVTATGMTVYEIGWDCSGTAAGGITQSTKRGLPRSITIGVSAGNSTSYTYSLGYVLTP